MRGGYQILALNDNVLVSGVDSTIENAYSHIANSNRKAILVTGLSVSAETNGTVDVLNDEYVEFLPSESGYTGTLANGGTITVSDADAVTYTAPVTSED